MIALGETASHLSALGSGKQGEHQYTSEVPPMLQESSQAYQTRPTGHQLVLEGCQPSPLASYLKALGVLRVVAEQLDGGVRGYWSDEQFVLVTELSTDVLSDFLLNRYVPTPILAPWNGGSGFYPKDNQDGIGPIERGGADRFEMLRECIRRIRKLLADRGYTERPGGEGKAAFLAELRAELPEPALHWLDAAVVLTEQSPRYPPLLGTGGNDGRLDFTNNFMQRLVAVVDPGTGTPRDAAPSWLAQALFGQARPGLPSAKVGQFAPGDAGGVNQLSGFEAEKPLINPWDFILMLEGALLFASAATRRMHSQDSGAASFPFTVRSTGAGSGAAAPADEDNARAELWAPLWNAPASLAELTTLLAEGRVTLGRRPARDGLDFTRAVSQLGVERGISAFQRYAFLMRSGKAYFATPLNRINVERNPAVDLVDQLDTGGWLGRFRAFARRKDAPNRARSLSRQLEDALFTLTTRPDDPAPALRSLLAILGAIDLYLADSPKARAVCPPLPSLSSQWLTRADDGSAELHLAVALASLHAVDQNGHWALPMRRHLAPERAARKPQWDSEQGHSVTWHGSSPLLDNLRNTLNRRLLQAEQNELPDKPLAGTRSAPLAAVSQWLAAGVDERRLGSLLPGLALVRIPFGTPPAVGARLPLPMAYRVLKPMFCTNQQLRRVGLLLTEQSLPLPAEIIRRLEANDVDAALGLARRRLRAYGVAEMPGSLSAGTVNGKRLLAALMVPISEGALKSLLRLEKTPETEDGNPD